MQRTSSRFNWRARHLSKSTRLAACMLLGLTGLGSGQWANAGEPVGPALPGLVEGVATADLPAAPAALASQEVPGQQFDMSIMKARGLQPELSNYFRQAARFSAGKNIIDVVVNGVALGRKTAFFSATGTLCFTPLFLQSIGLIDASDLPGAKSKKNIDPRALNAPSDNATPASGRPLVDQPMSPGAVSNPSPEASVCPGPEVVSAQTVVTLSPPQVSADITTPAQTLVALPAARIEQGGSAGMLNYRASSFSSVLASGSASRFTQVDSQAGFNWNDWIVRSNQSYSSQNGQSQVRFVNAYGQKTFVDQKQILQGGLTSTQSPLYGGLPLLGVQWFPETALNSQSKYPITGIASTRARVIVTQNGVTLLSTVVPPGPFRLTDYPQGNRTGDFQVQVIEATGAEQRFTIAASTVLLAQDTAIEGGLYAAAGLLSNADPASGQRPVPLLTLEKSWSYTASTAFSTGALAAGKYVSVGVAVRSQADMAGRVFAYVQTQASRDMQDGATGMVASSSLGWSPSDVLQVGLSALVRTARYRSAQEAQHQSASLYDRAPSAGLTQMGANLSWNAGRLGSLNGSFTRQTPAAAPASNTYAASWSTSLGSGSLSLGLARTQQSTDQQSTDQQGIKRPANDSVFINFSTPLGRDATVTSNVRQNNYSGVPSTVVASSLSHRLTDALSYQASVEKPLSQNSGATQNVSFSAVPRYASVTLGAGNAPGMRNYFAQASGGVILTGQGASFAPNPIQDTFAVVKLGDMAGVQLSTPQGTVWSGFNGLTAVPGLTPFASSTVEIVTASLSPDVDVDQMVQVVRAARGAVVHMEMKATKVQRVLLTVTFKGEMLPANSPVMRGKGEFITASAQNGRLMISDFKSTEIYTVRLPDGSSCKLGNVQLNEPGVGNTFQRGVAVCQ